jgi:DNA-binding transcriptional regulator LsrR (DeoR family)
LVDVVKIKKRPEIDRDKTLEGRLSERFKNLNRAIVINHQSPNPDGDDEALHQKHGVAMAEFIVEASAVLNNALIGVGSGGACDRTLSLLQYFPPLRCSGVTLMSITGSVYSRPRRTGRRVWFDADSHVTEFARHFHKDCEPSQYLISHPLAYEKEELDNARKRVWFGRVGSEESPVKPPTHLLVGIAPVAENHRFHLEAVAPPEDQEPFLSPIHDMLETLVRHCEPGLTNPRIYGGAAEMSNLLFYVPPDHRAIPRDAEVTNQAIRDTIDAINGKLLTIQNLERPATASGSDESRSPISKALAGMQLMVVAGTRAKARPLLALLRDNLEIACLCTDSGCGEEILLLDDVRLQGN